MGHEHPHGIVERHPDFIGPREQSVMTDEQVDALVRDVGAAISSARSNRVEDVVKAMEKAE
jgi:hypothetical protein